MADATPNMATLLSPWAIIEQLFGQQVPPNKEKCGVLSPWTTIQQLLSHQVTQYPHATIQQPITIINHLIYQYTKQDLNPHTIPADCIEGDISLLKPHTAQAIQKLCTDPPLPLIHTMPEEYTLYTTGVELYFNSVLSTTHTTPTVADAKLTISIADHDDIQYTYDRVSHSFTNIRVPDCAAGRNCSILTHPSNNGRILQQYLLPEEERLFHEKGVLPLEPGVCIHCHRSLYTMFYQTYKSVTQHYEKDGILHNPIIVPPFTNLCDEIGGYKRKHMILAHEASINCFIVKSSDLIQLRKDPITNKEYWDQTALKYTGEDFCMHNNQVQG